MKTLDPRSPISRFDSDSLSRFIRSTEASRTAMATNTDTQIVVNSSALKQNEFPQKSSLAERIPLFGLIMSFLSVICFSLCSLIVKILTDLHALEILGIR